MTHLLAKSDARRLPLPDGSVQCCVTSPPYFGLRDYGVDGQLGLEDTPAAYVAGMVAAFKEVRRVLRDDGVCWLNIGDSYNSAGDANRNGFGASGLMRDGRSERSRTRTCSGFAASVEKAGTWKALTPGLKPKDALGIPWALAFALRDDGWYLRSEIIWSKPNPMPESVRDRPTKSHEQVFLLTKSEQYFYDQEAVKEKGPGAHSRGNMTTVPGRNDNDRRLLLGGEGGYRNLRSVWTITPQPFAGAHFATFPVELADRCIRAGTSEQGCCPSCGRAWERMVERVSVRELAAEVGYVPLEGKRAQANRPAEFSSLSMGSKSGVSQSPRVTTLGWSQSCSCPAREPVPCLVLDPFSGVSTTGVAALALGRRYVGFDLSAEYLAMARRRIERPHIPARKKEKVHPLFAALEEPV